MSKIAVIFLTVFLAELGDKTQLATLLFATDKQMGAWMVFFAASAALVASTGVAVLLGTFAEAHLSKLPLDLIAGAGFILIGVWTIWGYVTSGNA